MVKFNVNVKLVEKRANRSVGKVMVTKVMIHMSRPGTALTITNNAWPNKPSHEVGSALSGAIVNSEP